MKFEEYDIVRISSLLEPNRAFDGTEKVRRAPRIGDRGTIVHVAGSVYSVESVDADGKTIWLADFLEDELEKADEIITENYYIPVSPKAPTYVLGAFLGSITAYLVASFWLSISPPWVAFPLGAIAALFGVFILEPIVEAIMLSVIFSVLIAILMLSFPGFVLLKAAVVPLACGLITGKLVVGFWKEIYD